MLAIVLENLTFDDAGGAKEALRRAGRFHRLNLRRSTLWLIPIVVCGVANAIVFAAMLGLNPDYARDQRLNDNPDARHYVLEGRNTLLLGYFSRCASEPYVPDMLRTPIYPLFSGALDIAMGAAGIYFVQAALHVLVTLLTFLLASKLLNPTAGFVAAMLVATDLMLVVSNFEAMSEMLFLTLTLGGLVAVAFGRSQAKRLSMGTAVVSALLFSLATLTRPAGLYVPLIVGAVYVCELTVRRNGRAVAWVCLFIAAYTIPVASWIARNYVVFGVPRLTTADAIMAVYFAGGGAYQIEHAIQLEVAQHQIAREFDLPPPNVTNNHWVSEMTVAEMDSRLRAAQSAVLGRYPASLAMSSLLGIGKCHISHNVSTLAQVWGMSWVSSSTGNGGRLERLLSNHPVLLAALAWQLAHTAIIWSLLPIGVWFVVRQSADRWLVVLLLAILAYFLLTVALVGAEAYHRSRTPHMPLVAVLGGCAAAAVFGHAHFSTHRKSLYQSTATDS